MRTAFLRHPAMQQALLPVKRADTAPGMSYDIDETAKQLRDLMDYKGNQRVGLEDLKLLAQSAGAERLRNLISELTKVREDPVNTPGEAVIDTDSRNEDAGAQDIDDPTRMDKVPDFRSDVDTPSGTGHGPPMYSEDTNYYG